MAQAPDVVYPPAAMKNRLCISTLILGLFGGAGPVLAQSPATQLPKPGLAAKANLEDRLLTQSVSPVDVGRPLATDESRLNRAGVLEHRLRAGGELDWHARTGFLRHLGLAIQADVFAGPLWRNHTPALLEHDPLTGRSDDPLSADHHLLRRFAGTVTTTIGRLSVGRMVSTWGLGLLAQSGDHDDFQFGVKRGGTVVDRAQFATMPAAWGGDLRTALPLFLVLAVDRVVQDDLADLANGDSASNMVAALLYKDRTTAAGVYAVRRNQEDERGLTIDATVADVFVAHGGKLGAWKVQAATEWLVIAGETTYFRTPTNPDLLNLLQYGGVVRLQADRKRFGGRLEVGLASGDDDPFDDTVGNLKFAADHRVGLVLFGEGLRRLTATGAANLADPRFTGSPPQGFERLATGGAVSQALYINPVVRFEPFTDLALLGGVLWARSPRPLIDPYQTGLAGGALRNQRGGKAGQDLGIEVDAAVRWKRPLGAGLALHLRLDAGVWLPGEAFDDAEGRPMAAVGAIGGQALLTGEW